MTTQQHNILSRNNSKMFFRELAFNKSAVDIENRTIDVSFSSEEPYMRWFGNEILEHSPESVDLSRLQQIGVSLFNHNKDYVIGTVLNPLINADEKRGHCKIRFDEDEESEKIFKKVQSGTLKGVSVGYTVETWEDVEAGKKSLDGRFEGPVSIAKRWTPFEVSIVSVPADAGVGVGRDINDSFNNIHEPKGEKQMTISEEEMQRFLDGVAKTVKDTLKKEQEDENKPKLTENEVQEEVEKAVKTERKKMLEINSLCREFDVEPKDYYEKSLDDVRKEMLEKAMKTKQAPAARVNVSVTSDEEDTYRSAASDAVLMRAGLKLEKPAEGAKDMCGMSLRSLAVECLQRSNDERANRYSDDELLRKSLTPGSAFSSILDNSVNKSMSIYDESATTYQLWTGEGSLTDFKEQKHYRISEAGEMKLITENGEFEYDELKDEGITRKLYTYGKKFGFTREAFINDDLGVFSELPRLYVQSYYRFINNKVYKCLTSSQNIYDGKPLFDTAHKNVASAGAAIATVSISDGRKAMRQQKGLKSKAALNIVPKFLIVGPEQETAAEVLVNSIADPNGNHANVANIFKSLIVVCDAAIQDKAWYLAANPSLCDTVKVSYLNGQSAPHLETRTDFDRLGIEYRIYGDVGVDVLDFRGLYKNAGA